MSKLEATKRYLWISNGCPQGSSWGSKEGEKFRKFGQAAGCFSSYSGGVRDETVREYEAAIGRALERAFCDPEATVATLADAAGFSAFHFSRMFAGMVGESPGEFLRRIRLERAALALKSRRRVTEVALDAGYESLEAFSRAFRSAFGCVPSAFAATGFAARLPAPSNLHIGPGGARVPLPRLSKGTKMHIEIQESVPARRVVAIRHVGPYPEIGPVFGKLMAWVQQNGIEMTGPGLMISHDDPESVPAEKLRSDACAEVSPDFATRDASVQVIDVPGGRYTVATHLGSYAGLGSAWGQLMGEWLPASGATLDFTRPSFEVYLDDCDTVAESELRTELYQPVL